MHATEETLFSQERFVRSVVNSNPANSRVVELKSKTSSARLFGFERSLTLGRRYVELAPFGLWAYPNTPMALADCVPDFVAQLKALRNMHFDWNVRFDHIALADELKVADLDMKENTTHVLFLNGDYETHFRDFSATIRNKIRRSQRDGIHVCQANTRADVAAYYKIYEKLIGEKDDWNFVYRRELLNALFELRQDVVLLLAEIDQTAVAGGWFLRDGNSLCYWQGSMDYDFKRHFPHCAVLAEAIRMACDDGMVTFNMGASLNKLSLENFKSLWGTRKVPFWRFSWTNPFWSSVSRLRQGLKWPTRKRVSTL